MDMATVVLVLGVTGFAIASSGFRKLLFGVGVVAVVFAFFQHQQGVEYERTFVQKHCIPGSFSANYDARCSR